MSNLKGIWRHVKTGRLYKTLGTAIDADTLEERIIYRSLDDGKVWDRTLRQFLEMVGEKDPRPRFVRELDKR